MLLYLRSMIISDTKMNMTTSGCQILDDLSQVRIVAVRLRHGDPVRQVGHQRQAVVHSKNVILIIY